MATTSEGDQERVVAHHEAGHVIAGRWFGRKLRYVTIRPDGKYLGGTHWEPIVGLDDEIRIRNTWLDSEPYTPDSIEWYRKIMVICFAGPIAERRFLGLGPEQGSWEKDLANVAEWTKDSGVQDIELAKDSALKICGDDAESVPRLCLGAILGAEAFLREPQVWQAVETLAAALLNREMLSHMLSHSQAINVLATVGINVQHCTVTVSFLSEPYKD